MKYINGFFMAWGMFSFLPCPYKRWDEKARGAMLAMFPLIGTLHGIIMCAIWLIMENFGCSHMMTGAIMTGCCLLLTGFIHLDGFMDVSDAVMSRRPELEERQRILKDSRVGAFAVICLVIMMLLLSVSMITVAESFTEAKAMAVIGVLTVSRSLSAFCVMNKKPMDTSQYRKGQFTKGESLLVVAVGVIVVAAACVWLILARAQNPESCIIVAGTAAVTAAASGFTGCMDRKNLGGMNGDISGHMLTVAETAGLMALALLA